MAGVRIDKGPLQASARCSEVPQADWDKLLSRRYIYITSSFNDDCRMLLQFVDEAKEMYEVLGYSTPDELIEKELKIDPADARLAYEWLEKYRPDFAIPYAETVKRARAAQCALAQVQLLTVKPGNPTGNNQYQSGKRSNRTNSTQTSGTGAEYLLRRLARSHPDIFAAYQRGQYKSVRQAAIAAGIVKVKSPDEKAIDAWNKAENRLIVLSLIVESLEPHELAVLRDRLEQ